MHRNPAGQGQFPRRRQDAQCRKHGSEPPSQPHQRASDFFEDVERSETYTAGGLRSVKVVRWCQ